MDDKRESPAELVQRAVREAVATPGAMQRARVITELLRFMERAQPILCEARGQDILALRADNLTQHWIAGGIGVTEGRVQQIEKRAKGEGWARERK